jgi:hypothetical protein
MLEWEHGARRGGGLTSSLESLVDMLPDFCVGRG